MLLYIQVEITNYLKRMIKTYITVHKTVSDKSSVSLFEDYQLFFEDVEQLADLLGKNVATKIEEVEKINEQVTSPF